MKWLVAVGFPLVALWLMSRVVFTALPLLIPEARGWLVALMLIGWIITSSIVGACALSSTCTTCGKRLAP